LVVVSKENMFTDVDSIIWAWSPRERWTREKIKINEKVLAVIKAQQE
jgi:hypothetical protein